MNEDFIPKETVSNCVMRELFDWVEAGMIAVVCVVLLFTFVVRTAGVSGVSMNPTLADRDRLLISRVMLDPSPGDIVVVTKPNSRNEPLIKRVVAVGGQTIDIDFMEGVVYIDGVPMDETAYVAEPTYMQADMQFPQTVPEGHVFVMGDNRNASWDSRVSEVGMVDQRYILGKVIYRLMPYDQMGVPY